MYWPCQGPEGEPLVKLVVNSDLNTGEMIGVVFACLFVVIVIIIFIFICYKKCRKIKKDFYMHVDIPSLPPLREADSMRLGSHHYHQRPLPQIPQVTTRTVTGDDGYSSADTDPNCEPGRYEPIVKPRNNGNAEPTKRNVSETSETLLLPHMEGSEDPNKCQPYQVTPLVRMQDPTMGGKSYKNHRNRPYYKKAEAPGRSGSSGDAGVTSSGAASVDSYLQVDIDEEDPQTVAGGAIQLRRPLLDLNSIPQADGHFLPVPDHEPQIQFVMNPPPPSEPPPSPAPDPGDCTDGRGSDSPTPSDNASYISGVTQLVRPFLLNGVMDANRLYLGQYAMAHDGGGPAFGYVQHDQALVSGHPAATSMTSTPDTPTSTVRPLSEYMKHLPLSFFEEPTPDQELGPTTEL